MIPPIVRHPYREGMRVHTVTVQIDMTLKIDVIFCFVTAGVGGYQTAALVLSIHRNQWIFISVRF